MPKQKDSQPQNSTSDFESDELRLKELEESLPKVVARLHPSIERANSQSDESEDDDIMDENE